MLKIGKAGHLQTIMYYSILPFLAGIMVLLLAFGSEINALVAVTIALLPLAAVAAVNPKWTTLITIILLVILEEFPWGLGESTERSIRTPFYGTSLGIPGFYLPDLLIFGSIFLLLARAVITRRPVNLPRDKIQVGLTIITALLILSALISVSGDTPFHSNMAADTATAYKVNKRGAELIALFQLKNFSFLIFSYVLGLLYFERKQDVERLLTGLFIAIVIITIMGFTRILIRPSILLEAKPLFYHSPSSWIFALTIFYWVVQWVTGNTNRGQFVVRMLMAVCLGLFILVSYRRTMWGSIAFSMFALVPLLHGVVRRRYLMLLAGGIVLIFILVLVTPPLQNAILSRITATSANDLSSLYRLSLFVWFRHNLDNLPLFGYGLRPLWDISASLGYFRTNLENIHSLYFWILLRVGLIGFLGFTFAGLLISAQVIQRTRTLSRQSQDYYPLCVVVALAMIMMLFSGIFNPVYAEIRYVTLMGFALAFISRLPLMTGDRIYRRHGC